MGKEQKQQQWKQQGERKPDKQNPRNIINNDLGIETGNITEEELDITLKKLKGHKAPGPDKVIVELIKFLDQNNKNSFY